MFNIFAEALKMINIFVLIVLIYSIFPDFIFIETIAMSNFPRRYIWNPWFFGSNRIRNPPIKIHKTPETEDFTIDVFRHG
uniref:X1.D.H1.3 n=1 Tax=Schmidtea mediterranea TaxID=79327 RepID=V9XRV2_SCHMD|nr:X1.D.H1.3 [Schmidtea mediterranea]